MKEVMFIMMIAGVIVYIFIEDRFERKKYAVVLSGIAAIVSGFIMVALIMKWTS